jgi:hypothetical protein
MRQLAPAQVRIRIRRMIVDGAVASSGEWSIRPVEREARAALAAPHPRGLWASVSQRVIQTMADQTSTGGTSHGGR